MSKSIEKALIDVLVKSHSINICQVLDTSLGSNVYEVKTFNKDDMQTSGSSSPELSQALSLSIEALLKENSE